MVQGIEYYLLDDLEVLWTFIWGMFSSNLLLLSLHSSGFMAEEIMLTVVATVADTRFGVVFGFRSMEDFALYACQISRVMLINQKNLCCKSDIYVMSIMLQKSSNLILYTICFKLSIKREKRGRRQKDQQNSELFKFFKKVLFKQQFKV